MEFNNPVSSGGQTAQYSEQQIAQFLNVPHELIDPKFR